MSLSEQAVSGQERVSQERQWLKMRGGVRAAYNKHFMHGVRAAAGRGYIFVGTYFP